MVERKIQDLEERIRDMEYEHRWSTVVLKAIQSFAEIFRREEPWIISGLTAVAMTAIITIGRCELADDNEPTESYLQCANACGRYHMEYQYYGNDHRCECLPSNGSALVNIWAEDRQDQCRECCNDEQGTSFRADAPLQQ